MPPRQVGQRPGHPDDPVDAAGADLAEVHGPLQRGQRARRGAEGARSSAARHLGVQPPRVPASRRAGSLPGLRDPPGHDVARLGELAVAEQLGPADREQLDLDVHPVQQRPGQPAQVAAPDQRRAGAGAALAVGRAHGHGLAARISVNRAGKARGQARPGDHDLAGLEGLAQRVEHVPVEFRRFVQEQTAVVGQGGGAGPDDAAAAADDRGLGRGVVRRAERRLDDQRAARRAACRPPSGWR